MSGAAALSTLPNSTTSLRAGPTHLGRYGSQPSVPAKTRTMVEGGPLRSNLAHLELGDCGSELGKRLQDRWAPVNRAIRQVAAAATFCAWTRVNGGNEAPILGPTEQSSPTYQGRSFIVADG
jgi:hypothetical protein